MVKSPIHRTGGCQVQGLINVAREDNKHRVPSFWITTPAAFRPDDLRAGAPRPRLPRLALLESAVEPRNALRRNDERAGHIARTAVLEPILLQEHRLPGGIDLTHRSMRASAF